jgi:pimeloyl-ACP methyl ester carboxylesterase
VSDTPRYAVLRRAALGAAAAGAGTAAAAGTGSVAAAAWFARRVLTPEPEKPEDVEVVEVRDGSVVLGATAETVVPGRYGLWLDDGAGHVRLGDPVGDVPPPGTGTVERELLGVDAGAVHPGPARWNQYFFRGSPSEALGVPTGHLTVTGELGPMPAWLVPPAHRDDPGDRWAVLVHGRGATREECLRAVPPLRAAGWTCLVPTYRNDDGVPAGPDGRYNLGLSEWRDVEAAVRLAVDAGAREVVLVGWSMGGAIVLQLLSRSPLAGVVSRVVLDAPVVDWSDVIRHHARLNHVPVPIATLATRLMGRRGARRLVGVHDPLDVAQTDWVARAGELRHRLLLVHSADDEFVPVGPSRALADARPDLVTYEEWQVARHTKEWNTDPERWERVVTDFVSGAGGSPG